MALKSLFLGILFSMGIFAVKSGFGLNYYLGTCTTTPKRIWGATLFTAIYGLIFIVCAVLITTTDLMAWFPLFQIIISHAMTLHFLLAVLMCIWSLTLIRKKKDNNAATRSWMLLALPCPVCMVVIFLSVAFLIAYAPGHAKGAIALLFFGFAALNLSTLGALSLLKKRTDTAPEHLLGNAMLFIALYFLLSVVIMPQFTGIEEIYSLSLHGSPTGQDLLMEKRWTFTLLALLFTGGTVATSGTDPLSFYQTLRPGFLPRWRGGKQ